MDKFTELEKLNKSFTRLMSKHTTLINDAYLHKVFNTVAECIANHIESETAIARGSVVVPIDKDSNPMQGIKDLMREWADSIYYGPMSEAVRREKAAHLVDSAAKASSDFKEMEVLTEVEYYNMKLDVQDKLISICGRNIEMIIYHEIWDLKTKTEQLDINIQYLHKYRGARAKITSSTPSALYKEGISSFAHSVNWAHRQRTRLLTRESGN